MNFKNSIQLAVIGLVTLSCTWADRVHAAIFVGAAAQLGAVYNSGLAPIGVPALSVTGNDVTGFSSPGFYFPYTLDGINNPAAGFTPDLHWVGDGATTPAAGTIWTFGSLANDYYLYPTIDHDPVPSEALESSLHGSSDGGSTWIMGTIMEVYEQGWDPLAIPDDGATRWYFATPVNMISAVIGLSQGTYSYVDTDYELDAVMQVPEPSGIVLAALGLIGLAAYVWRRKR